MDGPPAPRLVGTALRCYPARWRRRHGDEAAELAALLIRDGAPAGSIAWSYLAGAAREWLTPRPGRPLTALACALLAAACLVGVSTGLLASAGPARAASTARAASSARAASTARVASSARAASSAQVAGTSPARGRPYCRPGSAPPFSSVLPAVGHPQLILPAADHARPC